MIASVSGKRLHCNPVIIILIIALALMLICHFQKRSELTHFTNCMGCPVSITGVGSEKPSHPSCQHHLPLNCDISRRLCQLRSKCPLVFQAAAFQAGSTSQGKKASPSLSPLPAPWSKTTSTSFLHTGLPTCTLEAGESFHSHTPSVTSLLRASEWLLHGKYWVPSG